MSWKAFLWWLRGSYSPLLTAFAGATCKRDKWGLHWGPWGTTKGKTSLETKATAQSHWPGQKQRQEQKWGHPNSSTHETQDLGDFKHQKPAEPVCCKSRRAAVWLFSQMLKLYSCIASSEAIQKWTAFSPIHSRKLSISTGRGNDGWHCCHSIICPRWKERERNMATQCSAWRKRNTGSFFRALSWLGRKYSHDKAIQFSNNSCTAKQLSALVSRGFCSGL